MDRAGLQTTCSMQHVLSHIRPYLQLDLAVSRQCWAVVYCRTADGLTTVLSHTCRLEARTSGSGGQVMCLG